MSGAMSVLAAINLPKAQRLAEIAKAHVIKGESDKARFYARAAVSKLKSSPAAGERTAQFVK